MVSPTFLLCIDPCRPYPGRKSLFDAKVIYKWIQITDFSMAMSHWNLRWSQDMELQSRYSTIFYNVSFQNWNQWWKIHHFETNLKICCCTPSQHMCPKRGIAWISPKPVQTQKPPENPCLPPAMTSLWPAVSSSSPFSLP